MGRLSRFVLKSRTIRISGGEAFDCGGMDRPRRVAELLLATGIPPLAFTIVLLVLGSIPDSLAPYLTITLVLVPMSLFLPLFALVVLRHAIGTARMRLEKEIPTSCIICGETLPRASLGHVVQVQGPHYATTHPEFWSWRESRRRMMPVMLCALGVLWGIGGYGLVVGNYPLFIGGGAFSVVVAFAWEWSDHTRLKGFRNLRE
jgi:hypothetical protein